MRNLILFYPKNCYNAVKTFIRAVIRYGNCDDDDEIEITVTKKIKKLPIYRFKLDTNGIFSEGTTIKTETEFKQLLKASAKLIKFEKVKR